MERTYKKIEIVGISDSSFGYVTKTPWPRPVSHCAT